MIANSLREHYSGRPSRLEFEIIVPFTRTRSTLRALKKAGSLAKGLNATIRLLVPHIVPYPIPLEKSLVGTAFRERTFRLIAAGNKIETRVDIRLCRSRWQMLQRVLDPASVIVVGMRRRWWPTWESRLIRKLGAAGYQVIAAIENSPADDITSPG